MKNLLNQLQKQPYETRVKILWGATAVIAIIIIGIWSVTLKGTIDGVGKVSFTPPNQYGNDQTETSIIVIERAERINETLKIYFNVTNDTDDILNFSKAEDIELRLPTENKQALSILDRQGLPMVQKILSRTKIFGTVTFPDITEDKAALVFTDMFLESNASENLKQTFQLDLKTLIKNSEVRN